MTQAPLAQPGQTSLRTGVERRLTNAQLRIIRLSVARSCTDAEFDHFISVAERTGLDPLRGQISALVRSPWDPEKRTMIPYATIDGLRAIAARHGDYRPMEGAPLLETDAERRDARNNPLGLVRAEVTIWRKFDGTWFPITGEAWWDEYAVLLSGPPEPHAPDSASDTDGVRDSREDAAQRRRRGTDDTPRVTALAARWARMGRVLLAKCAEAQALRRGWPENLSGLYGEEELQRVEVEDLLAHERAARATEEVRQRILAGGRSLALSFTEGGPLELVGRNELAPRLAASIAAATNAEEIEALLARNRDALRTFWEWLPGDALDIKRQAECAIARFNGTPSHASAKPIAPRPSRSPRRARPDPIASGSRSGGGSGGGSAASGAATVTLGKAQLSPAANQGDQDPAA